MAVSVREFARRKGVSDTAIHKAVERGEITREPDGRIDPAKNAHWSPRAQIRGQGDDLSGHTRAAPEEERPSGIPDYAKSRAIREAYAARLAKLEFEEKSGRLVSADEVRIEQFRIARALRDRLLQLPAKIAPEIVALVVEDADVVAVEQMLETALRELLAEFVPTL